MAKNQNLIMNPNKISGVCGRLMCCLMFEKEQYGCECDGCSCQNGEEIEYIELNDTIDGLLELAEENDNTIINKPTRKKFKDKNNQDNSNKEQSKDNSSKENIQNANNKNNKYNKKQKKDKNDA